MSDVQRAYIGTLWGFLHDPARLRSLHDDIRAQRGQEVQGGKTTLDLAVAIGRKAGVAMKPRTKLQPAPSTPKDIIVSAGEVSELDELSSAIYGLREILGACHKAHPAAVAAALAPSTTRLVDLVEILRDRSEKGGAA